MPASGRACPSTPALAVTQTAVTLSRAVEMQRPSDLGRSSSCWIEPRDGIRGEPIGAVLRGDAWQVVLVAAWILDRFHVRDDLGVFELDDETLFEVFDEVVACWIVSRRLQHVHGDVAGMAGDAGPDGVKADVVGVEVVQDCWSRSCSSVVSARSMSPSTDPEMRCQPVQMMLHPTSNATMGSSWSQPVRATSRTPSTTPAEVHRSVIRCLPSAVSVIERCVRPAR